MPGDSGAERKGAEIYANLMKAQLPPTIQGGVGEKPIEAQANMQFHSLNLASKTPFTPCWPPNDEPYIGNDARHMRRANDRARVGGHDAVLESTRLRPRSAPGCT